MLHRLFFKNRAICTSAAMIAMFVISGLAHGGAVLFVDDDAPQGGDGTTWDTAYRFLQDALADASGGGVTEIHVGQGTYKPDRDEANPNGTGDRLATYQLLSDVALVGGFAGIGAPDPDERDVVLYQTILNGDIGVLEEETDNSKHIVTGTGASSTGVLDGFTITLGFADIGFWPEYVGSGMLIFGSGNPTIVNCVFVDNTASDGGAIFVDNAAMTAISTRFTNNRAFDGAGGAMVGRSSTITAADCVFEANTADRGGAVAINNSATSSFTNCTFTANEALFDGGAIRTHNVPVTLMDCSFTNNVAIGDNTSAGGALSLIEGSDADVQGCSFVGNSSLGGGAVWVKDTTPSFVDCSFDQNSAENAGAILTAWGTSANLNSCVFTNNVSSEGDGGAVNFGQGATSIVTNCQFINNSAREGGGLRTDQNAEPIITGCTFIGNTASMRGGGFKGTLGTMSDCLFDGNTAADRGGGAFCSDDDSKILNCTFVNNSAEEGGGLAIGDNIFVADCIFTDNVADRGGAVFARQDQPTFLRCLISGNTANANGGGFYLTTDTLALVVGCTIVGNTASLAGGGAFVFDDSIPTFVNCRFSGNLADTNGGGINFFNTDGTVVCCSFSANAAAQSGGGIWTSRPTILQNSILWGNSDDQGQSEDSQIHRWEDLQILMDYSCVQGLTGDLGGSGNIGDDPLFVDPDGPDGIPGTEDDDLRLAPGSPCIDAADNTAVPPDEFDLDDDGDTDEPIPFDLDGNPRFVDDLDTKDSGNGDPPIVDMGAYEFQGAGIIEASFDIKPGSCPNSFNRNSHGMLPTAILGSDDFDAAQIDISSVMLSRADGIGGSVAPHEGPPGPHSVFEDVATPFDGETCDCHDLEGDGFLDLSMHFLSDEVVEALQLNDLPAGDLVELVVSGTLLDGTEFSASDCIRLVPPGTPPGMMAVGSNAPGVFIDVSPLDLQLDGGGFANFERTFPLGSVVTLTAPQEHQGRLFVGWNVTSALPLSRPTVLDGGTSIDIMILGDQQTIEAIYEAPSSVLQPPARRLR